MTKKPTLTLIEGRSISAEDIAQLYKMLTGRELSDAEMGATREELSALTERASGASPRP